MVFLYRNFHSRCVTEYLFKLWQGCKPRRFRLAWWRVLPILVAELLKEHHKLHRRVNLCSIQLALPCNEMGAGGLG